MGPTLLSFTFSSVLCPSWAQHPAVIEADDPSLAQTLTEQLILITHDDKIAQNPSISFLSPEGA